MYLSDNNMLVEQYKNSMYELKLLNKAQFINSKIYCRKKLIEKLNGIPLLKFLTNKISKKFINMSLDYEIKPVDKDSNYFSTERIAIYIAIYGDYDKIIEPIIKPDNCDFFIFTDKPNHVIKNSVWKVREINLDGLGNIHSNRYLKMHAHKLFPEYNYSVYVDGNIQVITDLTEFIHGMNKFGLKLHRHYRRKCVYDEIEICIKQNKDDIEKLLSHKDRLLKNGFPKDYGVLEAPIIVREHHNKSCIQIMESWWEEFQENSSRDQVSLPYVLWKNNITIDEIALLGNDIYSNYAFKKQKHNKL